MKKPTPKKMHDADVHARELIGRATEFSAFQYRFRERKVEYGFKSIAEADRRALEFQRECPNRGSLVYAIVDGVSHPVPDDMRLAARKAAGNG